MKVTKEKKIKLTVDIKPVKLLQVTPVQKQAETLLEDAMRTSSE